MPLLHTALLIAAFAAGQPAPPVDPEAMGEASRADSPGKVASAQAYAHYLRARQAEIRGDFRAAAEELQQALAHDPASPQLRLSLAEVLARLARLPEAEAEARRALAADPQGAAAAEAHLLLGKLAALQRQRDRARTELLEAMRAERALAAAAPERERVVNPEPWRLLGELQLEAGDEAGAAKTFEELSALLPGEVSGLREMGRIYLERRDYARAERYLRRALERAPSDEESWRKLGQLEEARRRPEEARKAYEALLRADPDDLEALLALGRLALRAGDGQAAGAWFSQLLRLSRDEAAARLSVVVAYLDARRPADALRTAEEGLVAAPEDGRLRYARGLALQEQRRWAEAADAFASVGPEDADLQAAAQASMAHALAQAGRPEEALKRLQGARAARPRDVRLITAQAFALERAGRAGEAVRLLEKALAERQGARGAQESRADLTEALAASLQKAGRPKDAVALLLRATAASPADERLRYALGVAQDRAADRTAAIATMEALIAANPDHADALNFVGYGYAERGVELEEAERLIRRALDLQPENGFFLDSLGWVHFQKGEFARAAEELQRADALAGPDPAILEHLGDALRAAQRPSEAAAAYGRALQTLDGGAEPERPDQRSAIERKRREVSAGAVRAGAR